MSSSTSLTIPLEIVGPPGRGASLVFRFNVIALWSKSVLCKPWRMSHPETSVVLSKLIRKKSILDLFLLSLHLGLNVKSLRVGKNILYGSVSLRSLQRSSKSSEWRRLGNLCIFKQSMLVSTGSLDTVQFQSPPKIIGKLPNF